MLRLDAGIRQVHRSMLIASSGAAAQMAWAHWVDDDDAM